MLSAVVSFHTNPFTCGVARFNQSLAHAMNVEMVPLSRYLDDSFGRYVLLSLKLEEINVRVLDRLNNFVTTNQGNFALLLHGINDSDLEAALCARATRVYAASREIARKLSGRRSDAIPVFAPGAPVLPPRVAAECTLLTLGMAHKIRVDGYRKLARLMQGEKRTFRLEISTALHEGGAFDEAFFEVSKEISSAFAGNVRFLGFLADAEVSERLRAVDAFVAFFPNGARENNTTVLSAMTHGCAVLTNLDSESPSWMVHNETVFNVNQLTDFPVKEELIRVGNSAVRAVSSFTFENLATLIRESSEPKQSL